MTRTRICFVVLDHQRDAFFDDLVAQLRWFCPGADVVHYDSGPGGAGGAPADPPRMPGSSHLQYAKVTQFFLDTFEWAAKQEFDYIVNVESDMAFIAPGFEDFVLAAMRGVDHLAPGRWHRTPDTSTWRPYLSLRPELPELLSILGLDYTNGCFTPGQVFSIGYIRALVASHFYPALRDFVRRNQRPDRSFSLQEVLLPTVADALDLPSGDYPAHMGLFNRWRPYHDLPTVKRAHVTPETYFVHPVRRHDRDPARRFVRGLVPRSPHSKESACPGT